MLQELGDLDPGDGRALASAARDVLPRREGVGVPAEATEQPGPLGEEVVAPTSDGQPFEGDLQAIERLERSARPHAYPGEPGQVAGRDGSPAAAISQPCLGVGEQPRQ